MSSFSASKFKTESLFLSLTNVERVLLIRLCQSSMFTTTFTSKLGSRSVVCLRYCKRFAQIFLKNLKNAFVASSPKDCKIVQRLNLIGLFLKGTRT